MCGIDAGGVGGPPLGPRHLQQTPPAALIPLQEGIHDGLLCRHSLQPGQSPFCIAAIAAPFIFTVVVWRLVAYELEDVLLVEVLQGP